MDDIVGAHAAGERQAGVIDIGCDHAGGTGRLADSDREQTDRTASRDQHVGARDLGSQRRVERVAHWIVDAADFIGHGGVEAPDVGRRHGDEIREASVAVDADDPGVGADVRVAGPAEQAVAVDDVAFGRHAVADLDIGDERARLDDVTGELVADDDRRFDASLGPVIPGVDVYVRAAHAGAPDADEDLIRPNRGFRHFREHHAGAGRSFYESAHREICSKPEEKNRAR